MSGKLLKDKLIKGDRVYGTFFQHAVVPALVDFLPPDVLDSIESKAIRHWCAGRGRDNLVTLKPCRRWES